MVLRLARVLAVVCVCAIGAMSMPVQSPIAIDDDIRIFAMVTALNVSGFDAELGSEYHPVRAEIRKIGDGLDPALLQRMREYYSTHKAGGTDEDQLAKYISLAVVLTDPPFKPVAREESLPDDARSVLDFAPLLQEFYQKAGISRLWARVSPAYEAEMDRLGPFIRNAISRADGYMRASSGGSSTQTMKITVELGAPKNTVNVRSHHDDYLVVLGYAQTPKVDEIRHAYLHVRLNNYAAAAAYKVPGRSNLMALLNGASGVQREFSSTFENMFAESLIRAVELRLDRVPAAAAQESVKSSYRSGLLLMPYFYESLPTYEAGDNPFREEIALLAAAIDVGKEQSRFQSTFNTIPVPQRQVVRGEVPAPPPATLVDPVRELLRTAEAAYERDKPRAREAFEKVLREYDPNEGRALYGLGLIEMDKADEDSLNRALQYFSRTIASTSADRSMKTWSYIYSGHILDFKCNRSAALENYRKALETGDDTRDAQNRAKRDMAQPFGGECQQ
jgi:tetratricopeptide (TPR) repeat protein